MPISPKRLACGSALLTALFIMTLVAIAATAMTLRLQLDIYKTKIAVENDKYYLASQLVVFWGMKTIQRSHQNLNQLLKKNEVAIFPKSLKHDYPSFTLSGEIVDLQGRFNINNIKTQPGRKQFRALLSLLNPGLDAKIVQSITRGAWYWQNSYKSGRGQDKLAQSFLKNTPPSLPAHLPFNSISELRIIPGVSAAIMRNILPYMIALPETTPININTASKPVLQTLGSGITNNTLNEIIEARADKPINRIEKAYALIAKSNIKKDGLSINSNYFMVIARVEGPAKTFVNYSLIKIYQDKKNRKKYHVGLIRESINSL